MRLRRKRFTGYLQVFGVGLRPPLIHQLVI
jgi:hypothetical protein